MLVEMKQIHVPNKKNEKLKNSQRRWWMKYLKLIVVMLVLFCITGSQTTKSYEFDPLCKGYPFMFRSISQAGYFHMLSDPCRESQFRDVRTGRLIQKIQNKEDVYGPIILNDYIYTASSNDKKVFDAMTLINRDGQKLELNVRDGGLLFFFDDQIIQIHQENDFDKTKFWRTDGDEILWEFEIPKNQNISWSNGLHGEENRRDYIWIKNGTAKNTKVIDIRNGNTIFQINKQSFEPIKTNGLLSVCVVSDPDQKYPCIIVVDMDNGEVVWEMESDDFIDCFIHGDKATIILGRTPMDPWEETYQTIIVVGKNNGLEAEYKVSVPLPTSRGHDYLVNAKEHILCYSTPSEPYFIIKDARIDRTIWKPSDESQLKSVAFYDDILLINSAQNIKALDLNTLEVLWKHNVCNSYKIAEYDGLEYVLSNSTISVKDVRFDVIEPYEYDVSGIDGYAEYIPTKYGLLAICATGNNNSFNDIRLMRPGIEEPVYSYFQQSGWLKEWERTDNEDYIKLTWKFHGTKVEERIWYLHIPTGVTLSSIPKE